MGKPSVLEVHSRQLWEGEYGVHIELPIVGHGRIGYGLPQVKGAHVPSNQLTAFRGPAGGLEEASHAAAKFHNFGRLGKQLLGHKRLHPGISPAVLPFSFRGAIFPRNLDHHLQLRGGVGPFTIGQL